MPFTPDGACPVLLLPDGRLQASAPITWTGTHGDHVTIPEGRVSDLGTVPWIVRAVLPHDGPASRAFLVHDELCEQRAEYHRALTAWARSTRAQLVEPPPPPPAFTALDVDGVFRVILAELGVGPTRWLYWAGVRWGALANPARREGWLTPAPLAALLGVSLVALVLLAPAAVGALLSRGLMWLVGLLVWPWETAARRRRQARTQAWELVAEARKLEADVHEAERATRPEPRLRESAPRTGHVEAALPPDPDRPILLPPRLLAEMDELAETADHLAAGGEVCRFDDDCPLVDEHHPCGRCGRRAAPDLIDDLMALDADRDETPGGPQ